MKLLGTQTLETSRLILRKIEVKDYELAYKNWCSREGVDKYVMWTKHKNAEETKALYELWANNYDEKTFRWIIVNKENNEPIGTIDTQNKLLNYGTLELGYCLSDLYWNKGFMTEAANAVLDFLFNTCEAETISAEFLHLNPASGKVMEKIGMKYEGILRSRITDKQGIRNDLVSYSITKSEFNKQ